MKVEIRIVPVSKTDHRNVGILSMNIDTATPLEELQVVSRSEVIQRRNEACERWTEEPGMTSVESEPVPAWAKDRYAI